jgi:hypothetical protein
MLKNSNIKVLIEILCILMIFLLSLSILSAFIYGGIIRYSFPWYIYVCSISSGFILLAISIVEIYRLLRLLKRQRTTMPPKKMMTPSQEQQDEYLRQMQILCGILAARVNVLLHDLNHQQEYKQPDFYD